MVELRTLADAIEREAVAARATVVELRAYHELMRQYVLLIGELERNATLWTSATRPALERYTGVLYDALAARSFTRVQRSKAYAIHPSAISIEFTRLLGSEFPSKSILSNFAQRWTQYLVFSMRLERR